MIRADCDSVAAFCALAFTPASIAVGNDDRCAELLGCPGSWLNRNRNVQDWLGATTTGEAAERVTRGWPEGAAKVLANLRDLDVPIPMSVRRRLTRTDQGDELDIHAVNRGDLDHAWTARRRRRAHGRLTVRLIVQTNLLAEMSAAELFWRGAAAVKASDLLTAAGYAVEIVGALASEEVGGVEGDFIVTFSLKSAAAPLDVEALAGVICNAGFHRLFGFRAYFALAPKPHLKTGRAISDTTGRIIRAAALDVDGTRTFTVPYGVTSQAAAQRWITETIASLDAAPITAY